MSGTPTRKGTTTPRTGTGGLVKITRSTNPRPNQSLHSSVFVLTVLSLGLRGQSWEADVASAACPLDPGSLAVTSITFAAVVLRR